VVRAWCAKEQPDALLIQEHHQSGPADVQGSKRLFGELFPGYTLQAYECAGRPRSGVAVLTRGA
jgi:hypothetical protein